MESNIGSETKVQTAMSRDVEEALSYIKQRLELHLQKPSIGVICGSGLGGLSTMIQNSPICEIDYNLIPSFPTSTGEMVLVIERTSSCSGSA